MLVQDFGICNVSSQFIIFNTSSSHFEVLVGRKIHLWKKRAHIDSHLRIVRIITLTTKLKEYKILKVN